MTKLLSVGADAKTAKGEPLGYLTGALFMAPHSMGKGTVCPWADQCEST